MALEVQFTQHQAPVLDGSALFDQSSPSLGSGLARKPDSAVALDLLRPFSPDIELEELSPLPIGWQKFLDLKTGEVSYSTGKHSMSRRSVPKLDLKLNLSPPRANQPMEDSSPSRTQSGSPTNSLPSSCVSSELNGQDTGSPEATSMLLVGCPRCLMYVMLSEEDPKCPKCKSTVLLDFLHEGNKNNSSSSSKRSGRKRS